MKLILVTGVAPDFSKFGQKLQSKFTDVFNALIKEGRVIKGESAQARPDRNQFQAGDSKTVPGKESKPDRTAVVRSDRTQKPGDASSSTRVSHIRPGDPRSFIDTKLILLQALGILKPLQVPA